MEEAVKKYLNELVERKPIKVMLMESKGENKVELQKKENIIKELKEIYGDDNIILVPFMNGDFEYNSSIEITKPNKKFAIRVANKIFEKSGKKVENIVDLKTEVIQFAYIKFVKHTYIDKDGKRDNQSYAFAGCKTQINYNYKGDFNFYTTTQYENTDQENYAKIMEKLGLEWDINDKDDDDKIVVDDNSMENKSEILIIKNKDDIYSEEEAEKNEKLIQVIFNLAG